MFRRIIFILIILGILSSRSYINDFINKSSFRSYYSNTAPVGVDSRKERIGYPSERVLSDSYKFMNFQDDGKTPVSWDPCRPIRYVINKDGMVDNGEVFIKDVVKEVSRITGYKFIFSGYTDENYSEKREPYQPKIYGNRWAPVLFTFSRREDNSSLLLGEGGGTMVGREDLGMIYVSGFVDIRVDNLEDYLLRENIPVNIRNEKIRAVILHEVGHVMGLDHSEGAWDIMYPEDRLQVSKLSTGDKSGLVRLAETRCYPKI